MKIVIKSTWQAKLALSDKTKAVLAIPKGYSIHVVYNVSTPELIGDISTIEQDETLMINQRLVKICDVICNDILMLDSKKNEEQLEIETKEGMVSGAEVLNYMPISFIDDVANGFFSNPNNNK